MDGDDDEGCSPFAHGPSCDVHRVLLTPTEIFSVYNAHALCNLHPLIDVENVQHHSLIIKGNVRGQNRLVIASVMVGGMPGSRTVEHGWSSD